MFYVYKNSEDTDATEIIYALTHQPELRSYPFVQVPLNVHLFHLDVASAEDESGWQRFIFGGITNVFEFLLDEKIREFLLYIQTRRQSGADYQLKRVVEILEGYAVSGESVYLFSCANGSIELDGFSNLTRDDIVRMSSLWKESKSDICSNDNRVG